MMVHAVTREGARSKSGPSTLSLPPRIAARLDRLLAVQPPQVRAAWRRYIATLLMEAGQ